jgi:ribosomal protein L11 methyltransferase
MNSYTEIHITSLNNEVKEILIALLAESGYEGFLEEGDALKAYIPSSHFKRQALEELRTSVAFDYETFNIREENWNALWEASFDPVIVDDYVAIRADFHDVVDGVEYEIVITPKMSFGTGHHATTFLVIREMRNWEWKDKTVLDFGTGTGILAILASKSGASEIQGIDNDPWSIENARENLSRNQTGNIRLLLSGEIPPRYQYDMILANINKHILLEHAFALCESLNKGGGLIISGILKEDITDMVQAFSFLGKPLRIEEKNNWLLISFMK